MALDFPWQMFAQAQGRENEQARRDLEDLQGTGQNIGSMLQAFGQRHQEAKRQKQWSKTINEMMMNPNVSPQAKAILPLIANQPGSWELLAGAMKPQQQGVPMNFGPGGASLGGGPSSPDNQTISVKPDTAANILSRQIASKNKPPPGSQMTPMAQVRQRQNIFSDLPSRSNPNTASGAAYMVKVAARQGKSIIAKPGSPQQVALAASDLARAVQRSAPQLETLQGSSFSNNLVTQMNMLTQKLTADPSGKDVPKIRRQIYDLLDELDKTAQPWIENDLKNIEDIQGPLPKNVKNRELGLNVPDVPFIDGSQPNQNFGKGSSPQVGGVLNGKKIVSVEPL